MPGEIEVGIEPALGEAGNLNRECPNVQLLVLPCATAIAMVSSLGFAQSPSPNGGQDTQSSRCHQDGRDMEYRARAGDFVFVAGMQGIDPATNTLVQDLRREFGKLSSISG